MNVCEKMRQHARAHAAETFKDHKITEEGEGRWFCGKPGDSNCHFRVVVSPGAVFMHGDLYELILLPSDRDALAWLRSALKDDREGSYALSKIPHSMKASTREFSEELAEEVLAQHAKDYPEEEDVRTQVREAVEGGGDAAEKGQRWNEAWYEASEDCEFPSAETWTPMVLWQLEALRWFVRNLPT